MMRALDAAHVVNAPQWLIGSGAVRNLVWDRLHGRAPGLPIDVDLVFHDVSSLEPGREEEIRSALCSLAPEIYWDVKNQAAVHLWYGRRFGVDIAPLASVEDAVATWPETASCVGVRLLHDREVEVVAPLGLDDLFDMVWRRNPRLVTVDEYRLRLRSRNITERWPSVRVAEEG